METLEVTLTHPAAAFAAMTALEGMSEEPPHADVMGSTPRG